MADNVKYEWKVISENFGDPTKTENEINTYCKAGWEFYSVSTMGPIPQRWLYFRRPVA